MNGTDPLSSEQRVVSTLREKLDLVGYFAVILITTPVIAGMLAGAWNSNGLLRTTVLGVEHALSISHDEVELFFLGGFGGLLALMWLDRMKRVQAILMTIAAVIGLRVFQTQGILFPVDIVANTHVLGAGFVVAFLAAGGSRIRDQSPPWEFRRATKGLAAIATLLIGIGFVESHLLYESPIEIASDAGVSVASASTGIKFVGANVLVDLLAAGVFVGSVVGFTTYESAVNVFKLGAQRVGKSTTETGMYDVEMEFAKQTGTKPNPTQPLSIRHQSLITDEQWGEYNGPNNKGEYEHLAFRTQSGKYLPKYVRVGTVDYAGEYVNDKLAKQVASRAPKSTFSIPWFVYKAEKLLGYPKIEEEAEVGDSQMYDLLAQQIVHADKLVIMLDAGGIIGNTPYQDADIGAQQDLREYVDTYVQILRHLNQSTLREKDVMIAVTKADYFKPLYEHDGSSIPFRQWVQLYLTDERRNGNEQIKNLLNMAQAETVYPINFAIDERASKRAGEPIPEKPIKPQGHKPLLARIKQ